MNSTSRYNINTVDSVFGRGLKRQEEINAVNFDGFLVFFFFILLFQAVLANSHNGCVPQDVCSHQLRGQNEKLFQYRPDRYLFIAKGIQLRYFVPPTFNQSWDYLREMSALS